MKKYITCIIFLLLTIVTNGQIEKVLNKKVADNFEKNYNNNKYAEIFLSFSPEMQQALPIDKTKEFFTGLKTQAGKITKKSFVEYQKSYAAYKTNFEQGVFVLNISVDSNAKINGFLVQPFKENSLPKLARNATNLILPFKNEWTVTWGGDTKALNYHVESEAQKNAFDLVITNDKGNTFKTDGIKNEDYYAFGKELIAPCDGEIVLMVDGVKDNVPGILNPIYVPGNTVIIKTAKNEFLFFAHFKQRSIVVKQGQKVIQGQLLGLCGNSGNSSEPHLHFHIQNVEDMQIATGAKCFFEKIMVDGKIKTDYSPIQKEKISNVKK
jgi:murein DD-endopeptidase MepM/ murein hydrolase activator NlpD